MIKINKQKLWDFYEKAPRPLLRWVCIPGTLWVFFCDWAGYPIDSSSRIALLGFVALVYGLRGWEKLRENSE